MKKLLLIALLLSSAFPAYAAPQYTVSRTILPEVTNLYELGTTTRQWLNIFSRNASTSNATTTNLYLPNIVDGLLKVVGGVVQRAIPDTDFQVPLTFGDGLTRTSNDVDCDTANASTFGCLTSADWTSFNNKVSTSSLDSVWALPGLGSIGSSTATTTFPGNVDISGSLRVVDRIIAATIYVVDEYFYNGLTGPHVTATSTSIASIFPLASTTALTVTNSGTGLHVASNSLFENTSGVTNLTVGDGTTVQTKRIAFNSPANDASQSQLQFQQAGTAKWSIYRAGNTDALNIYSHTLATDVIRATAATTSLLSNDVNIIGTGASGATFWNNEGSSTVAPGSLTIGQATPGNGLRVTRIGGTDSSFFRATEAGGAFLSIVDGTGIQLNMRDTGVNSRVNLDTNGDNYISPATGNVYFIPAAGSVAVGTSTPSTNWAMQIAGAKKPLVLTDTGAGTNAKHWTISSLGGNLYFASSSDAYATSTNPALSIVRSGTGQNVGIGTGAPNGKLDIVGAGTGGSSILLDNNTFISWRNNAGSVRTLISSDSSNNVNFKTSDSLTMRFLASTGAFELARLVQTNYASFGVGTTSPSGALAASSTARDALVVDRLDGGAIAKFLGGTLGNIFEVNSATSTFTKPLKVNHLTSTTTAVSISSCGTGGSVKGNNTAGKLTVGTGLVSSCVINWGQPHGWSNPDKISCFANQYTNTAGSVGDPTVFSITNTSFTLGSRTTFLGAGNIYNWYCIGYE